MYGEHFIKNKQYHSVLNTSVLLSFFLNQRIRYDVMEKGMNYWSRWTFLKPLRCCEFIKILAQLQASITLVDSRNHLRNEEFFEFWRFIVYILFFMYILNLW